jgi:hypothetical protein
MAVRTIMARSEGAVSRLACAIHTIAAAAVRRSAAFG